MKRGTKIGWILVAISVVMSIWVIASQKANANQTIDNSFVVSDDGTQLVQYIGEGGNVSIPEGIQTIDAGVFANNTSITSVTIPGSVTSMGVGVFQGCVNLSTVTLGNGITSIPDNTFRECQSLGSVSLPAGVGRIGSNAFYGCSSLSSISIPAATTVISTDAFDECLNLTNISVTVGNSAYASADGCLYNASATKLLLVPRGKTSVSLAAGTTVIGGNAFTNCVNLSSLSLPSGVTSIESNAFSGSGIVTLTVPASVTSIGSQSGWTPTTIEGYADTYAETYAKDNGISFVVIGESGNAGEEPTDLTEQTEPENPAQGETPSGEEKNTNDGTAESGQAAPGSAHVKDATPTTADGIDSRYFLCLAVFAGGIGVILYSRFNKMKYVSKSYKKR